MKGEIMENRCKSIFDAKVIFGLAIIILGLVMFLENLGIICYVLILLGIGQLAQPRECRQPWTGIVLIAIGVLFLGNNLEFFYFRFRDFWPLILILIGLSILRHTVWNKKDIPKSNDFVNLSFILGGGDHNYSTKNLQGGKITAIMGGGSIDLRDTNFPEDKVEFDVFAFWGGFDITVPRDWSVNVQVTPIMGGIENKVRPDAEQHGGKTLVIRGTVIMGGVEVKN
jgi:predicted membrane protein